MFTAAVADGLIRSNPCVGVKLPKAPPHKVVPLDVAQVRALADAAPDRYRAVIITGAGTGLRLGELLGLDLARVDFLRRRITVDRQLVDESGVGPTAAETLNTYAHLWPDSEDRTREAVDEMLGAAFADSPRTADVG